MGFGFNSDEHRPKPFAAGVYHFEIDNAEERTTATGNFLGINLTCRITGPSSVNRQFYAWFNVQALTDYANPRAVEIGLGELSEMSRAVGLPAWQDCGQLIGRRGQAKLRGDGQKIEASAWLVPDVTRGAPTSNPGRDAYRGGPPMTDGHRGGPPQQPHPADLQTDDIPF